MRLALLLAAALGAATGCAMHHRAVVRTAPVPALPPAVLHSSRLWITLEGYTPEISCTQRGARPLCFERLHGAIASSLERSLWPSFPSVAVKEHGDNLAPGDYLLIVDLDVDALPPGPDGPGWSAGARGQWRLVRDGMPIAGESVASRSRADFAYGRALGAGAGEVIDALAVHIGRVLGELPETRPERPVPLPAVATRGRFGALTKQSLAKR